MYEVVTDPVLPQPVGALTLLTVAVVSCTLTPAPRLTNRNDLLYLEMDVLNIVIFLTFSARSTTFVTVNFYDKARSFQNSNLSETWMGGLSKISKWNYKRKGVLIL